MKEKTHAEQRNGQSLKGVREPVDGAPVASAQEKTIRGSTVKTVEKTP